MSQILQIITLARVSATFLITLHPVPTFNILLSLFPAPSTPTTLPQSQLISLVSFQFCNGHVTK